MKHQSPTLPPEVWLLIFKYCDTQTLHSLKDTCKSFKEWTQPLLVRQYFQTYEILWDLFKYTCLKFQELNSGFILPFSIENNMEVFGNDRIDPVAVRMIHLMHKNISVVVDDTVQYISNDDISNDSALINTLSTQMDLLARSSTSTSGGAVIETTSTAPTTAQNIQRQLPSKYTDIYEQWANFDENAVGIDREANYQLFRAEVGRKGSGVLSREYVRWKYTRREVMRRVAILVARIWSLFGIRQFPFSHSENKTWKERRRKRGTDGENGSGNSGGCGGGSSHGRERSKSTGIQKRWSSGSGGGRRRIKSGNHA